MKQICCIDCVHCNDYTEIYGSIPFIRYSCDAGSVMKEIADPEESRDCADFKQFIEDI